MLHRIVRWGQWAAIVVLPGWVLVGSAVFASGGGWYVFALLIAIPTLLVLLVVGPLISLAVPRGYRSPITAASAILTVVLWVVVLLNPLALEEAGDGPVGPSFFERLGMPSDVNQLLWAGLWAAVPVLLMAIWATFIVSAVSGRRASRVSVVRATGTAALQ
ncbi:MAG: hypothetical protein M3N46_14140 [Actinomycetota bacterium]|nr:hypothetical protein [Actinomycetota bacterium]